MSLLNIEGGVPLTGNVELSGSKNTVIKLIAASMFSNADVILEDVPRVENVLADLDIIKSLGGRAEWINQKTLLLNGSTINTYEIPYELGSEYRTSLLYAGPLIYRFGQAVLPKSRTPRPFNRFIDTWRSLHMGVKEDDKFIYLKSGEIHNSNINFKISTHMGTENAILSSLFVEGETLISNAAEESEVDYLIDFCKLIGAEIERIEPRKIRVIGKSIFAGGLYKVPKSMFEAVTFCVAALMTSGNITIKNPDKTALAPFMNVLTKVGCKFEFGKDELRVWQANEKVNPFQISSSPAPGFLTHWLPLMTLLATKAEGESLIHDTIYTDSFDYIKDLNRMGAKIDLYKPSDLGMIAVISDDSYEFDKAGEPTTVAKVLGPTKLHGNKINISGNRDGAVHILAALAAEGRSEIGNFEIVETGFENFYEKLLNLGAKISLS